MSRAGEHESTQIPPLLAPMLLSLGTVAGERSGCSKKRVVLFQKFSRMLFNN